MVAGEEVEVFAGKGGGAVEGAGKPFVGEGGEAIRDEVTREEAVAAVGEVFDVEAEVIENADEVFFDAGVGVARADPGEDGFDVCGGSR